MNNIFTYLHSLVVILLLLTTACSDDFLNVKNQKSQTTVETLEDVAALLDNTSILNKTDYFKLISDGDISFTEAKLMTLSDIQRNLYLWKKDYDPADLNKSAWDAPYQQIMYANIVLETLQEMKAFGGNEHLWNELYGRALFYRAWAHYHLAQEFAEGFNPEVDNQLAVPIIIDTTLPKKVSRASLKAVYDFIIKSLLEAEKHLPKKLSVKTRPSGQAALALLARTYLSMQDYKKALHYAEKALEIDNSLIDYNLLVPINVMPFSEFNHSSNPEIIFFTSSNVPFMSIVGAEVNDDLYQKYVDNDLRKRVFYNQDKLFTGTYSGRADYHFTGIAIDELYLVKAECLARLKQEQEAVSCMNELLAFRCRHDAQIPSPPSAKVLEWLLDERQKELVGRGTRWSDLKRLNRSPQTQVDLLRTYEGNAYSLPANSSRYVFAIPKEEIDISGLEQNIRTD